MQESTAKKLDSHNRANLNSLSIDEKNHLAETTYLNENYFQEYFKCEELEVAINKFSQQFQDHVQRILIEKKILAQPVELEYLHDYLTDDLKAYDFAHGVNQISSLFYETDALFNASYLSFIHHLRSNIITEPFYFQSTPTIRIHCPNAINASLYPRYHTDICYGHPPEEVNIWIPLTKKLDGHGFSLLSLHDSEELLKLFNFNYVEFINNTTHDRAFSDRCENLSHPAETEFGNALLFDPRCIHSGEPLKSHTRISIDMRIITVERYHQMNIQHQGSGRLKILFEPGACYHQKSSDEI